MKNRKSQKGSLGQSQTHGLGGDKGHTCDYIHCEKCQVQDEDDAANW